QEPAAQDPGIRVPGRPHRSAPHSQKRRPKQVRGKRGSAGIPASFPAAPGRRAAFTPRGEKPPGEPGAAVSPQPSLTACPLRPRRFWASVEPYCADLTNEEVRVLEELLKPPEDEAEHYKIPPLGKHYSQRWAQEDLLEEQKDGARAAAAADKKKGVLGPLTELDTKDVDALLKKSEAQHEQPEDGCPFGPLTQRLLQALVEENIISPVEDSPIPEIAGKDSGADGAGTSPRSQNKPFRLAKEELHRQELRQRVRMADNEVMDAFRKIMAARQKKRTPTKKEKDQAWKTLKERESILKLLDG
uniref:Transcriptional adaptor 3 n=1 Tax=Anser brachyrhynchus TaxID=132585 RepID=A0A8B9CKD0_9AVES